MHEAIYHNQPPSQAAFLRKQDLKSTGYLTIPVSYDYLKNTYSSLTIDAYDLYITLLQAYSSNSNEKFKISAKELMYKAAFTRSHTYHNAKNQLLTYDLVEISTGRMHNSVNTFKPKRLTTSCFLIPHSVYFWLNNWVRDKKIPRAGKLAFIFLYQQFVLQNYPEYVDFKNTLVQSYLGQSRMTYFRLLQKLKSEGLLGFSEITNQHQMRQSKLFLPKDLPLPPRANAPRPVLPFEDSQVRLRKIMNEISL